ncbi:MAG: DUF2235 domain-containing protein, partial [Polyangiaceae bacterium]|nr:DUF2235 domain-containing protein [Polyangiaceae bacterium]
VDPQDPKLAVKTVGIFDCVGKQGQPASMTDLAVDRDGKLYGVAARAIFLDMEIDELANQVRCSQHKVGIDETQGRFFGLTFAPPTAKLGTSETLIGGNTVGELYKIDTATGALTIVGRFGDVPATDGLGHSYPSENVGKAWALSGDMVFLDNQGSPLGFATLRDCPDPTVAPSNCSGIDTLVEIDVDRLEPITSGAVPIVTRSIRGQILPRGCSSDLCAIGSIYGIAAFDDKVYGFAYSGQLVEIDNARGEARLVSTPLSGNGFAGAGVSTLAPVIAPAPK